VVIAPSDLAAISKEDRLRVEVRKTAARCVCCAAAARLDRIHPARQLQQAQDFFILEVLDAEE